MKLQSGYQRLTLIAAERCAGGILPLARQAAEIHSQSRGERFELKPHAYAYYVGSNLMFEFKAVSTRTGQPHRLVIPASAATKPVTISAGAA